mgnify:CR=1 FL=1
MLKNQIRKKILNIRSKKKSDKLNIEEKKILKIIKNKKIKKPIVGCYYPVNSEVDTKKIMRLLEKIKITISLPIIEDNFGMEFYEYKTTDPLNINKYGIPEPFKKKKIKPNILIVPLVAFDQKLNRLGYGGGFYDRFLKKMEKNIIIKLGLAFSFQKIKKVPVEKFDKKLDYILTEKKMFKR